MQGFGANALLANSPGARKLGAGWIGGRLFDLGDYPGGIVDDSGARIFGELWELPTGSLRKLDVYEEYFPRRAAACLFLRTRVGVHLGRTTITAWTYVVKRPPAGARKIRSGRWRG